MLTPIHGPSVPRPAVLVAGSDPRGKNYQVFPTMAATKYLDWQVRPDQPLCLHALAAISDQMQNPDIHLFPHPGVSTDFEDEIAPSQFFSLSRMSNLLRNLSHWFTPLPAAA
jgi:hypothetical protein